MLYLNKSASPRFLVVSTSRLDTSVPFASIAPPSPSPSQSLSPPSLFFLSESSALLFLPLTSIVGIVSTSSCSAAAVVIVAAAWSHSFAFLLLLPRPRPPPPPPTTTTTTTIGNASSSSFLPSLRPPPPRRSRGCFGPDTNVRA